MESDQSEGAAPPQSAIAHGGPESEDAEDRHRLDSEEDADGEEREPADDDDEDDDDSFPDDVADGGDFAVRSGGSSEEMRSPSPDATSPDATSSVSEVDSLDGSQGSSSKQRSRNLPP